MLIRENNHISHPLKADRWPTMLQYSQSATFC